jgi:hypothetical protein
MPLHPRVIFPVVTCVAAVAGAAESSARRTDERFPLAASVIETVTIPERLSAFAAPLAATVERRLNAVPGPAAEERGRLLALRVHLALFSGDMERALHTANLIRTAQTAPAERAFAGLTTEAFAAAHRAVNGTGHLRTDTPEFIAAFRQAFATGLATLPELPATIPLLERQSQRIADLTKSALRAEGERLGAKLDGATNCGLEDADHIIRIGHRLRNLLPVRETMLATLAAEIAARRQR